MNRQIFVVVIAALMVGCASNDIGPVSNGPGPSDNDRENNRENNGDDCNLASCPSDSAGQCVDADGDGYGVHCSLGLDCDDNDPQVSTGAAEVCDGKDNDCNGLVDDGGVCDGCTDADGDGRGAGCTAGPDCDDSDPERFDDAPEACDGKDNDCDDQIDEDFELDATCSAGMGVCAADGVTACNPDGTATVCDADVGTPQTEVCDQLDNDCNGEVDDGLNCPACIEDQNEPNDRSTTGTNLPVGGSIDGQLCPGNNDWFRLGDYSAGETVSVTVDFDHSMGDIQMEMYVGASFETASATGTDNETITRTLQSSGAVTIWLHFGSSPGDAGNDYTIHR